jgi:hypothetical protein
VIRVETRVRIERPIEDVYTYVSDPGTFPHWNSAVQAVRRTSSSPRREPSVAALHRDIDQRKIYGGLVITPRGAQLIVADAAGLTAAQALTIRHVHPLSPSDSMIAPHATRSPGSRKRARLPIHL